MKIATCQLNEFLASRPKDSNQFLIGLAKMLNEAIIKNDLSWKMPTGIEGCMELLEKCQHVCEVNLQIVNNEIVGFHINIENIINYVDELEDSELEEEEEES